MGISYSGAGGIGGNGAESGNAGYAGVGGDASGGAWFLAAGKTHSTSDSFRNDSATGGSGGTGGSSGAGGAGGDGGSSGAPRFHSRLAAARVRQAI